MTGWLLILALLGQTPAADAPPPGKEVAHGAITAARNAIAQSRAAARREEASGRLREAEVLFAEGRYDDAAKTADAAWQLVSAQAAEGTQFSVEVSETGKTQVRAKKGAPVRVEAEGVAQPLYAGQVVTVEKGAKPEVAQTVEAVVPEALSPRADAKLRFKASSRQLGPIGLAWKPVPSAKRYQVEVRPAEGGDPAGNLTLEVAQPQTRLKALPAGRYLWVVRVVDAEGMVGAASEARAFEVVRDPVKIEVEGTSWK